MYWTFFEITFHYLALEFRAVSDGEGRGFLGQGQLGATLM